MPHSGICTPRAGSCWLHQHRDFHGAQSATEHQKCLGPHQTHFTRYMMAFITKDQKAKTVMQILYEQFISVFGMPAKLLSDKGMNFTSALVEELCSAFGIQKCRTTAYHTQCNGQVERFHQTLFRMIRKLAADKKAQWEQHLPELLQAYNSTQICSYGVLTPLPHVWEMTMSSCRLFLPYYWCKYKLPLSPCLCWRGERVLQRSLCRSPAPIQQWSGPTEAQLW